MYNLTKETIRGLTDEAYYKRGFDYYEKGRVLIFEEVDNAIEASVAGTETYKVRVDLDLLEFGCECLAYLGSRQACKHIVAVLLTKALGKKVPRRAGCSKPGKRTDKGEMDKETVAKKTDLGTLMKGIKAELRRMGRYGNYWSYVEAQDDFCGFVLGEIQQLEKTKESFEFLLDLAEWIDDKVLVRYDDSDGIFQDLNREILGEMARHFNDGGKADLGLVYKVTRKKHEFDLAVNVLEALLLEVTNKRVISELLAKLEAMLDKPDDDLKIDEDVGAWLLCDYYARNGRDKEFEKAALKVYEDNNMVRKKLIEFCGKKNRHKDVVRYAWPVRHNYYYSDDEFLLESLRSLKDWSKLMRYYDEALQTNFELSNLRELKKVYLKLEKDKEYEKYVKKLKLRYERDLDLLMHLKDYDEVIKVLETEYGRSVDRVKAMGEVEKYCAKFKILGLDCAKRLYKFLFEQELERMKSSNHYDNLIRLGGELLSLGERDYLQKHSEEVVRCYPTKKRLIERLTGLVKN